MKENERKSLNIFLPGDLLESISSQVQKTILLGELARFCSIFGIDSIIFYETGNHYSLEGFDRALIRDILQYLNTPQYLRKSLFSRKRTLKFVGLLPPLRTPNHPKKILDIEKHVGKQGKVFRQGYIQDIHQEIPLIDLGLGRLFPLSGITKKREGSLINVSIDLNEDGGLHIKEIERDEIPVYWGYQVIFSNEMLINTIERNYQDHLLIATSAHGEDCDKIRARFNNKVTLARKISIIFGPRDGGLSSITNPTERSELFSLNIDLFPNTRTQTVRLEEAIPIALFYISSTLR